MGHERRALAGAGVPGLEQLSTCPDCMNLAVLNVAYPFAAVGPDAVGGAEQVLSRLDAALVGQGHESLVLACAGSKTAGKLFATNACSEPIDQQVRARVWREYRSKIREICETRRVDLIHYHGVDFHEYLHEPGIPALVTLHLPPAWYPQTIFEPRPNSW